MPYYRSPTLFLKKKIPPSPHPPVSPHLKLKKKKTNYTHTFYLRGIPVVGSQSCAANCAKIVGRRVNEALTPCAANHWG